MMKACGSVLARLGSTPRMCRRHHVVVRRRSTRKTMMRAERPPSELVAVTVDQPSAIPLRYMGGTGAKLLR